MKGRIILFFTLMLAMTARAEVVEVDGFCYSETEGAQCVSKASFLNSDEIFIGRELQLVGKFRVSVYAQKEGYLDSEEAVKEFDLSAVGDVNGDGQITIADVTDLVNVILGKE